MTREEIKEIFGVEEMGMTENFKKEFVEKMVDLYKLLRSEEMGMGEVHFKDGIVFRCEIDTTNWVNKPVINLTDAIEKGANNDTSREKS